MKKVFLFTVLLFSTWASATHNRAGEITYTWKGGLTYEVQITTYTRSCNFCADRCNLTIQWGEANQTSVLPRVNGNNNLCNDGARDGEIVDAANEIKKNVYVGTHTYSAPGRYILAVEDENRNAGINNIVNSEQVPFYVESELFVGGSLGPNNSPILTNPPVERGCIRKRFEHNAGAYDPDKTDSLSYRLVPSRTAGGAALPSIYDAQFVQDSVKIDPVTGTLIWDAPQNIGQFNFAFEIIEWRRNRNGRYTKVGFVTRDLQIDIEDCGNEPPVVQPLGPFCVEAGQTLSFSVTATDPDGDDIELSAFGGPFEIAPRAFPFSKIGPEPLTHTFVWNTACTHVKRLPHQVNFKAEDFPPDRNETPLSDVYTVEITVIAPSPKNPEVASNGRAFELQWEPSFCTDAQGYLIYRREAIFGFIPDSCETGVPEYTGYEFLDSNEVGLFDTTYRDTNSLELGVQYCYMVVAYFSDEGQSYASVEFCASLPLTLPLITNADVENTDATTGQVNVAWIAPPEIDSALFPPPYLYRLFRSDSITGTNFTEIASVNGTDPLEHQDLSLNTQDLGYNYRVDLYSGISENFVGSSSKASSIFLKPTGLDEAVSLNMTHKTPWLNERYVIFRENPTGSGNFDSIAESFSPLYIDTGLVNGQEYCYRVTGYGRYTASDSLPKPLLNRSQIACVVARDTLPPCTPLITVTTVCPDTVVISWEMPKNQGCPNDVEMINIYFRTPDQSFGNSPTFSYATKNDSTITLINDGDLFGCFAATAVDDANLDSPGSAANESPLSEEACLKSCFELGFPNVFSPNGDGVNELFLPLNVNQLERLRVDIYNRWGSRVYRSASLADFVANGWNGTVQQSGQPAPEGVYYYVATFTPKSLEPAGEQVAAGFVHLFR
jgi:gliding motility-associated-like protein